MENHSYDNYLGMLPGRGEGFPLAPDGRPDVFNDTADGETVRAFPLTSTVQHQGVPCQSWHASHQQWDEGKCDGFVTSAQEVQAEARAALSPTPSIPRPRRPRSAWATGQNGTCRSTTGWPGRSRWPIAGSAPAWVRPSPTAGS